MHLGGGLPYPGPRRLTHRRVAADDAATGTKAWVTVVLRVEAFLAGCGEGGNAGGVVVPDSRDAGIVADRWSGDGTTCNRRSATPDGASGAVEWHATRAIVNAEKVAHLVLVSSCHLERGKRSAHIMAAERVRVITVIPTVAAAAAFTLVTA